MISIWFSLNACKYFNKKFSCKFLSACDSIICFKREHPQPPAYLKEPKYK